MPPVSPTKGGLLSALVGGFDGRVGRGGSRRLGGVGRRVARGGGEDVLGETELGHVVEVDRAAVGRLLRRRAVALGQHLALHPLDRQGEATPLGVDLEDLDLHIVARLDDLARVLDVVLGELGDVHEALDALEDLDEGPERDDLGDLPLELVADVVGVDHALPRVLLGLLEAQGDALAVAVDVEHLDLHRVADREDLRRVVDVRPRQLGDVDQAVDAVEVDEGAEVDDVRDLASMTRPGWRRSRIAWRCSLRSSSRTARRLRTTLLRERLSSMTFVSIDVPRYSSRFGTRRMSTSEAGRKPRTPRSTIRPPLTTSMTEPVTGSPDSAAPSILRQARSKRARFLERMRRPSWSSLVRTRASTSSSSSTSSEGSTDLRIESSLLGMTPSLLYPMSTRTSSLSMRTTLPVTTSPSSKGTMVAS